MPHFFPTFFNLSNTPKSFIQPIPLQRSRFFGRFRHLKSLGFFLPLRFPSTSLLLSFAATIILMTVDKVDPTQKLFTKMRMWEFPDQYMVEPTGGSSASLLVISFLDGSMKMIDEIPQRNTLRVPKIQTIYGVVGMLKLLAGEFYVTSMLARKMLELQLRRLSIFYADETISSHPNFDESFTILWANHGDDISIYYCGTPALKGDLISPFHWLLTLILADFFFTLMPLRRGMSLGIAAFVKANSRMFCSRPICTNLGVDPAFGASGSCSHSATW